jgi:hypothetical protein
MLSYHQWVKYELGLGFVERMSVVGVRCPDHTISNDFRVSCGEIVDYDEEAIARVVKLGDPRRNPPLPP